jgi:hypothetical protein
MAFSFAAKAAVYSTQRRQDAEPQRKRWATGFYSELLFGSSRSLGVSKEGREKV